MTYPRRMTSLRLRHLLPLLCIALCAALPRKTAAQTPMPKHEVRAVWLTTIGGLDWPHSYAQSPASIRRQQQELRSTLDKLRATGINTILLQTRIRATTIYPSAYEPWDGCLSGHPGTSPGYDALAFAIDEAHRRGMELHAWVVTIPIGKWNATGCKRLRQRHPGMVRRIGDEGYLNPEREETANYLADICDEITRNYDIDGIHLDYIRYPETWRMSVSPSEGRSYITRIVSRINAKVKRRKPWVKLSCSPVGKFDDLARYSSQGWNAYTKVCQDAQGWLRDGLMDELFPMMYFRGNQFYPFAIDWQENAHGRIVVPGLGIYFLSPREKDWPIETIGREMHVLRRMGLGHAYFRSKFLTDNTKGLYDMAATELCPHPALVPPMTWQATATPPSPQGFTATRTPEGDALKWTAIAPLSASLYYTYNIYASPTYPVDTEKAENLVAIRQRGNRYLVSRKPTDRPLYYAVTASDRYGLESPAAQQGGQAAQRSDAPSAPTMQVCGRWLTLPPKPASLGADYIAVSDIAGRIVLTLPYKPGKAYIGSLADGIYTLRSLGKKGVTHRLGMVMKKEHEARQGQASH